METEEDVPVAETCTNAGERSEVGCVHETGRIQGGQEAEAIYGEFLSEAVGNGDIRPLLLPHPRPP